MSCFYDSQCRVKSLSLRWRIIGLQYAYEQGSKHVTMPFMPSAVAAPGFKFG